MPGRLRGRSVRFSSSIEKTLRYKPDLAPVHIASIHRNALVKQNPIGSALHTFLLPINLENRIRLWNKIKSEEIFI
jgi:hypothetical protein